MRANDAELVEQDADRLRGDLRATIGVDNRLTRSDLLALESLRDEVLGDDGVGAAHEHPADDVAAENVDHHQQREPEALLRPADFGDVPREHLGTGFDSFWRLRLPNAMRVPLSRS